ncbi:hypothetical protein ANN_15927 [Periplaneta americana]|uniref:Uncharacterized protein n=1 Tax=Periplaneta americana TaxID=6978 RepID=A0ABQ8SHP7_PERAM|nr:hypothetical protein ANN_15927 [Periplaneta americana]
MIAPYLSTTESDHGSDDIPILPRIRLSFIIIIIIIIITRTFPISDYMVCDYNLRRDPPISWSSSVSVSITCSHNL